MLEREGGIKREREREREREKERERDSHVSIFKTKVSIPTTECMLEREREG